MIESTHLYKIIHCCHPDTDPAMPPCILERCSPAIIPQPGHNVANRAWQMADATTVLVQHCTTGRHVEYQHTRTTGILVYLHNWVTSISIRFNTLEPKSLTIYTYSDTSQPLTLSALPVLFNIEPTNWGQPAGPSEKQGFAMVEKKTDSLVPPPHVQRHQPLQASIIVVIAKKYL